MVMDWILGHVWLKPLIVPSIHFPFLPSRDSTTYSPVAVSHTYDHLSRVYIGQALFQLDVTMN